MTGMTRILAAAEQWGWTHRVRNDLCVHEFTLGKSGSRYLHVAFDALGRVVYAHTADRNLISGTGTRLDRVMDELARPLGARR